MEKNSNNSKYSLFVLYNSMLYIKTMERKLSRTDVDDMHTNTIMIKNSNTINMTVVESKWESRKKERNVRPLLIHAR